MTNFNKLFTYKIISIIIVITFTFTSVCYSVDTPPPPNGSNLRTPLLSNSDEEKQRLKDGLAVMAGQHNTLFSLRAGYLDYYQSLGHRVIPRQKLVNERFPDVFVRSADPAWFYPELRKYVVSNGEYIPQSQKACTVQPSHRYGDRSSQSKSLMHLQLFEMAAAWYIGEAADPKNILRDVLTLLESYGLNKSKLRFTVLRKGELEPNPYLEENNLYDTWLSLGIRPEQISFKGPEDNLWMQGGLGITDLGGSDTRGWLMGESTEIFYGDVEISNLLFPTFIKREKRIQGSAIPLHFKMCETVVGLDRLSMIVQHKESVFDIDSVSPLCTAIHAVVPEAIKKTLSDTELESSVKIIADDLRALIFLVADGASFVLSREKEEQRDNLLNIVTRELLGTMKILGIDRNIHLKYLFEQAVMPYADTYPELKEIKTFENARGFLDARQARLSRSIGTIASKIVTDKNTPGILRKLKNNPDYILTEEDYNQLEQFGLSRNDINFAAECFRACAKAKSTGEAIIYIYDFVRLASSLGVSYQELKSIMTRELGVKLTRDQKFATLRFPAAQSMPSINTLQLESRAQNTSL